MAAAKSGVKVDGVRELQGALRKVGAEAADMKEVHLAVATALIPGVEERTPRRSGRLASSWAPKSTKGRARITSTERYAAMIEYGVPERGIEPARMVRDTVGASHDQITTTYEDGIRRLSERVGFETSS